LEEILVEKKSESRNTENSYKISRNTFKKEGRGVEEYISFTVARTHT